MFSLSAVPLEEINLRALLSCDQAGAYNSFEGRVRNFNDGKLVKSLEYEACEELCHVEFSKIYTEIKSKFNVIDAKCIHRIGKLKIGEIAVWIGVISAHRDDAFKASRYIIDEIKKRLPIWKKENYSNGESNWVRCACENNAFDPKAFYSRQVSLAEIGEKGLQQLSNSRVLVVGAGGLGCSALLSLVNSGVGTIGICEDDAVEPSNLSRQILYNFSDIGLRKVDVAIEKLSKFNPLTVFEKYKERLTYKNAEYMTANYDCIIDCTDNFKSKFLLNDICYLKKIPLIYSSVYQFEGHIGVVHPGKSSCLRCNWPQIPAQDCTQNCQDAGVIGLLPGIFGQLQAFEALRLLLGLPDQLTGSTLILNLLNYQSSILKKSKNESCPLCSSKRTITEILESNYEEAVRPFIISEKELTYDTIKKYRFIDIREPHEIVLEPIKSVENKNIPMSGFDAANPPLDPVRPTILMCAKGIRSLNLTRQLRQNGHPNVYSLDKGISALNFLDNNKYAQQ